MDKLRKYFFMYAMMALVLVILSGCNTTNSVDETAPKNKIDGMKKIFERVPFPTL